MASYRVVFVSREADGVGSRLVAAALLGVGVLASLGLSACSFPVPGLSDDKAETTGSIGRLDATPLSAALGQEDLRRARGALAIALDPQGSGAAVKWDNPDTGASGTFTPVGAPFVKADIVCRAFLAAVATPARSSTLQGTACRPTPAEWVIRELKPWRKPD